MKFNNGLIFSTVVLALMATGCVKKQDNITASGTYNTNTNTNSNGIYDTSNASSTTYNPSSATTVYDSSSVTTYDSAVGTTTTLETAPPLVYDNGLGGVTSTGGYTEIIPDNATVITTNGSGSAPQVTDTYSDNYSSGAYSTGSGGGGNSSYSNSNTYSGYGGTDYSTSSSSSSSYSTPPSTYSTPSPSYSYSTPASSSSSTQAGGIHLQIAALKDYYAAQEFKNSLSLDPKYRAYIKRGAINKVIISGISSVDEANRLKERRFPGAFIVRNSGRSSSSSSSYSSPASSTSSVYGSSYSGGSGSYTDNSAYGGGYSSSSSSSSSASAGSIGIQIGAFSNRSKAQSVANANSGHYQAVVQQGTSRGRTIYRVILIGFSSRADAKRALASGRVSNGFVTTIR